MDISKTKSSKNLQETNTDSCFSTGAEKYNRGKLRLQTIIDDISTIMIKRRHGNTIE